MVELDGADLPAAVTRRSPAFEHMFYSGSMRANDQTGQRGHVGPKHVWVNVTGASTGRAPGILLDWRTVQGRWEAYVVWADGGGNVKPRAYLEWVRQEHVTRRD